MYSYIEAAEAENCERHTHFSICVVIKTINSHRDRQNMQYSYVKKNIVVNIYKHLFISCFVLSVMTYFWFIHPKFDKFRDIP